MIYIMGAGHIGSTILDMVLGNHPQIEGVGEVSKVHRSGWSGDGSRRCACGVQLDECTYWPQVRRSWSDSVQGGNVERYVALQRRYERFRYGWPRLLCNSIRPSADFKSYVQQTEAVYRAIQQVSGKPVVVDSSLTPRRAYALTQNPNIDLRLIHLVRDGRGCIWSLMKPGKQTLTKTYRPAPSWRTTKYWISANLQSAWVFSHVPESNRQRIRYEDFVSDPSSTMKRIGALVGEDLTGVIDEQTSELEARTRHTVGGCRVRMSKNIRIKADFAWMDHLPDKDRKVFWRLAGWLAQRYGYAQQPH